MLVYFGKFDLWNSLDDAIPMVENINITGGIAGGILIGLAASFLLAGIGRIAGISGIVGGLLATRAKNEITWRGLFVIGLVSGAIIYRLISGNLLIQMQASGWQLLFAGLLVGFGTNLGAGCTSGHGICGIARCSKRSFTATITFIIVAILTVFIMRHVLV